MHSSSIQRIKDDMSYRQRRTLREKAAAFYVYALRGYGLFAARSRLLENISEVSMESSITPLHTGPPPTYVRS